MTNFNVRNNIVDHPDFVAAKSAIEELHEWQRESGEVSGLALVGPSGSGKSTVLKAYRDQFPPRDELTRRVIVILYVEVPSAPTVKSLAEAILLAMGATIPPGATGARLTECIVTLVEGCGIELIMLDEFQHFADGARRRLLEVSDWLKGLLNSLRVSVVLAGLPSLLRVLDVNQQLRRRFSRIVRFKPFSTTEMPDLETFVGVARALMTDMPLPCANLDQVTFIKQLHFATGGLVDYMCKIIGGAYRIAASRKARFVDIADFSKAFRIHIWDEAPPSRDPFHKKFNGIPLTQAGEPFAEAL
ncbi:TniB family NTP-binding protein [Paraburkholderia tropica]|uniref:TniB family NTP-binding protein n=1 Tax=Paraburkholderia tropica TaxID=92647 RepID=UPI002AB7305D|nr:TniB family NTP-binding protein [Paraburkholderia tropica]